MAVVPITFGGCSCDHWRFIKNFHSDIDNFTDFFASIQCITTVYGVCKVQISVHIELINIFSIVSKLPSQHMMCLPATTKTILTIFIKSVNP